MHVLLCAVSTVVVVLFSSTLILDLHRRPVEDHVHGGHVCAGVDAYALELGADDGASVQQLSLESRHCFYPTSVVFTKKM